MGALSALRATRDDVRASLSWEDSGRVAVVRSRDMSSRRFNAVAGRDARSMSIADSILVIEDDPSLAASIVGAMRTVARVVRHTPLGVDTILAIRSDRPELLVADVGLPGLDAVLVCRTLREETRVPMIVLGARRSERDVVQVLDAGADDYLAKPFGVEELRARVRAQARRASLGGGEWPLVIELGELSIDLARRVATRSGCEVRLTPVEWQLLRVMAVNAGRTLAHQQIVHAVWGSVFGDA